MLCLIYCKENNFTKKILTFLGRMFSITQIHLNQKHTFLIQKRKILDFFNAHISKIISLVRRLFFGVSKQISLIQEKHVKIMVWCFRVTNQETALQCFYQKSFCLQFDPPKIRDCEKSSMGILSVSNGQLSYSWSIQPKTFWHLPTLYLPTVLKKKQMVCIKKNSNDGSGGHNKRRKLMEIPLNWPAFWHGL